MPMAAPHRIQAFPHGMTYPPDLAPMEAPRRPDPATEERALDDERARVRARRDELAARIAALKPHSRRRADLLGRLREATLEALRLDTMRNEGR